jgi:hypothetical protein
MQRNNKEKKREQLRETHFSEILLIKNSFALMTTNNINSKGFLGLLEDL